MRVYTTYVANFLTSVKMSSSPSLCPYIRAVPLNEWCIAKIILYNKQ